MTQPTAYEQYMLELVNRARLNFDAEINEYNITATVDEDGDGDIDYQDTLNYGRQAYINDYGLNPNDVAILSNGVRQVVAFNADLTEASRAHTQWMYETDTFSHYENSDRTASNYTGDLPWDRAQAAGYGSTFVGENIAWKGIPIPYSINVLQYVNDHHQGLFESFGHRLNIMNGTFRELGVGIAEGQYTHSNGTTYNSLITTEKFGKAGSNLFLTGVAFDDSVTDDDFYSVGEGLSGILVTAIDRATNQSFTTTTMDAGGYQLALAAGNYDVSFSLSGTLLKETKAVSIGNDNVKLDLNTNFNNSTEIINSSTAIDGTYLAETIIGGASNQLIRGFNGNDYLDGGSGNDTLQGLNGDDTVIGGTGDDIVIGNNGSDVLLGVDKFASNPGYGEIDHFRGGAGSDTFILGDSYKAYYNHQGDLGQSYLDRAMIYDFNPAEDKIELFGGANNYQLIVTGSSTRIFYNNNGTQELIGIVLNSTGLDLNGAEFNYVNDSAVIQGDGNNNILRGGDTNQHLMGFNGDDSLDGAGGDDTLQGLNGNDTVIGGTGNDIVIGNNGNDVLIGVDRNADNPGYGEVDRFRGSAGNDIFILGDADRAYYNYQGNTSQGHLDKAVLHDFNAAEDTIELFGSASNYQLTIAGSSTNIFYDNDGTQELIGVVLNSNGLDLNGTEFNYV